MKADKMTQEIKRFDKMAYLEEYGKQDPRLQNKNQRAELIANNRGINFERLMLIGRGVREIHTIDIFGQKVPMRVLSMREERLCTQQTYVGMKQFPEFPVDSLDFAAEFRRMLFRKMISLSTSSCPEFPQDAFLTESDLEEMPASTFADLMNKYKVFELEYNPEANQLDDAEIRILIGELQNPEKKSLLLTGMTMSQHIAITNRLLEMLSGREDNIALSTLLDESDLQKKTTLE